MEIGKMVLAEIKDFIRQTNTLPEDLKNPSGAFSSYYEFGNGLGCKVIFKWCLSRSMMIYKSKKALLKSRLWKAAEREVKFLQKAQKSGVAPKFYALTAIKITGLNHYDDWFGERVVSTYTWCPAIWMEHIEGLKLDTFYPDYKGSNISTINSIKRQTIINELKTRMRREAKLVMQDIQEDNVIVCPFDNNLLEIKNIRVIDFSPPFVRSIA